MGSGPAGVVLAFDSDMRVRFAQGEGLDRAGVDVSDIQGRRLPDVVSAASWARLKEPYEGGLAGRRSTFDFAAHNAAYSIQVSPIRTSGAIVGALVVGSDVTEQRRVESMFAAQGVAARQSERLLASAFDGAPIGMSVIDLEGRWLRVNDAYCRMFGYERSELLDLSFRELTHPEDLGDYTDLLRRAASGESVTAARLRRYLARDGSVVWVNLRTDVVCDDEGRPTHTVSLLEDVTEQRRVAGGLARSEARLRTAEEMLGGGSWELTLDREAVTWSDGFRRIHGVEDGASLDLTTYMAGVHPADRDLVREALARCAKTGNATVEYRIRRPDGALRTLRVEGQLVEPSDGEGPYLRGGALDVTDERAAFDAAPIGMLVYEPTRLALVRVNDAVCAMLGRTREELLRLRVENLTHPDDRAALARSRRDLLAGTLAHYEAEKRYLRPDGSVVWAAIYVTPVHNADGSVRAFSSQVIDITERKERGDEIQSARVDSLRRLAIASEYRDDDTHEHTERVAWVAVQIGRALGIAEPRLDLLCQAAPLHDIGKIGISDAILLKPERLTDDERRAMERHTLIGADILSGSDSPVLRMAEEIALTHHERWDGDGYPNGLSGEAIPLLGRIVAIADVFDALTHSRPYKEAWSIGRAVAHIRGERGRQFDPELVAMFRDLDHTALVSPEHVERPGQDKGSTPATVGLPRGRGLTQGETDERISNRDHAAADRDRAASDRDHTAAERDRSEAEADQRESDRDHAASDRDHAASERDHTASERDRSEARADRRNADREQAASDRELAATGRDETATGRDQTQAVADQRISHGEHAGGGPARRDRLAAVAAGIPPEDAESLTAHRDRAVEDRDRAASDRCHTAADRGQSQIEADQRTSNRDDAVEDREHAAADSLQTASDRDQAQADAEQRNLNRDQSAVDRALAAADRDQMAADRLSATIERDEARDELRRAQIDQLTGALGRDLGMVALDREINRARHGNGRLVLAFADVDALKQVNDGQGHAAGDVLLRDVVGAMQMHLRSYDPIVRYGGDEFVCALADTKPEDARLRFDEIQATIGNYNPGATISVGFAVLRPDDTLTQLINRGDVALYGSKRGGRS